jgi:cytochrome c biogenesis protein CcmG/thiol:disulfide interchange protein DsbE
VSAAALAVLLAVLSYVLATSDPASERRTRSPLLDKQAPALAGPLVAGRVAGTGPTDAATFDLGATGGKWVLVNFFGTYCIPCQIEHPELVRFAAVNPDDVQVVSVVFQDKADRVRSYFEANGGTWPVIDDLDGAIATRWGVARVPESYLVAPNGIVVSKIVGGVEFGRLQELLVRAGGG